MKRTPITLASREDTYHFVTGMPIHLTMTSDGQLRPMTRWENLRRTVRDAWRRATRWWRPRTVVAEIDHAAGEVTVCQQRWSWRRWRWEAR